MTSALEAIGQKKYFSAFSTLLDGLAPILTTVYSFRKGKKVELRLTLGRVEKDATFYRTKNGT
jgi:hypothetical protein